MTRVQKHTSRDWRRSFLMSVMSILALSVSMDAKSLHGFQLGFNPITIAHANSSKNVTVPDCQCCTK